MCRLFVVVTEATGYKIYASTITKTLGAPLTLTDDIDEAVKYCEADARLLARWADSDYAWCGYTFKVEPL
jgi:hypothetical protein